MKDELIYRRLFRTALLIRLVEERIIELYPSDKIQSPVHLSIGQEAVAVGVCDALRADDLVFATYRYKEHVGVGEDFHFHYRSREGVEAWKRRDPLIIDTGLIAELRPELEREIASAVAFAEASPSPGHP